MRLPSIKTLQTIPGTTRDTAKKIRAVLESTSIDAITAQYERAAKYVGSCYNRPPLYLVKLYAIDELLETYGIEAIDIPEGSFSNCQEPDVCIEYLNTGDTYALTLCRIKKYGKVAYRVTSWGDIYERIAR